MKTPSLKFVALAGLLTALAFPLQPIPGLAPICVWPLVFVAPSIYFARLLTCESVRESVQTSITFACVWFFVAGTWVFRVFDVLGWALIWLPVACIAGFGVFAHVTRRAGLSVLWIWPLLWIAVEFVRSEWSLIRFDWVAYDVDPLNFTWFGLGHPRCEWAPSAQSADLIGGYGLSLAPLLTNLIIARVWVGVPIRFGPRICIFGILAAETGYCVAAAQSHENGRMIPVGVVQSERFDIDVLEHWSNKLLASAPQTKLIVWPEESISAKKGDDQRLRNYAKERQVTLAVGVEELQTEGEYFNVAWWLTPQGGHEQYFKQQRVPFVEHHPKSDESRTFSLTFDGQTTKVGILICYDMDFPWNPRRLVEECGAEVIVMPTLDDVSWGGTQHAQHAIMPRLRAIENRRSVVQAATSGYSQIIDPKGNVVAGIPFRMNMRPVRTTLYREGFVSGEVPTCNTLSFYTATGHWIMPIATCVAIVTILCSLFRRPKH